MGNYCFLWRADSQARQRQEAHARIRVYNSLAHNRQQLDYEQPTQQRDHHHRLLNWDHVSLQQEHCALGHLDRADRQQHGSHLCRCQCRVGTTVSLGLRTRRGTCIMRLRWAGELRGCRKKLHREPYCTPTLAAALLLLALSAARLAPPHPEGQWGILVHGLPANGGRAAQWAIRTMDQGTSRPLCLKVRHTQGTRNHAHILCTWNQIP